MCKAHTLHHAWALTISAVLHEFRLQTYAPHNSLQSRCNLACFFAPFSFLCHSIFSLMPIASSSIDVWQQYITSNTFRPLCKNLFGNAFCHLHITMNSATTKQSHPSSTCGLQGLPWPYALPPADVQHGQEGQPYRCNVPILQELYGLIIEAYKCMPSSTRPAWLQADRRQIKVISSGCTPSSHIHSKCLRASLPCPCMAHPPNMAFQVNTFQFGMSMDVVNRTLCPSFIQMMPAWDFWQLCESGHKVWTM